MIDRTMASRLVTGGIAVAVCIAATARAQSGGESYTELTPSPTVQLDVLGGGQPPPIYNVSTMKIDSGNWSIKPIYERLEGEIRVIGLFASLPDELATGSNLTAVFYSRGETDCDPWGVVTWSSGTAWDAAVKLKEEYEIPDAQDAYWELEQSSTSASAAAVPYDRGFVTGDPLASSVNLLPPPDRQDAVDLLEVSGYKVADIPFEKGDPEAVQPWLVRAAMFFDAAIGRNLDGTSFSQLVEEEYVGKTPTTPELVCDAMQFFCNWWYCPDPDECTPETVYGEWTPVGDACFCETAGPWSAGCFTVKADANGKVHFWIPYPPPLGTDIELEVGVGVTWKECVCVWQRTCTADATRTVVRTNSDCSTDTWTETTPGMVFTNFGWAFAYPASQCSVAGRPAKIPPNTQPCGLENPTP